MMVGLLHMEKFSRGIQHHITLVVLLAVGGVARDVGGREQESLLLHHLCESCALLMIDGICLHLYEFHTLWSDTEGIIGKFQVNTSRHAFKHLLNAQSGLVQVQWRNAHIEIGQLYVARRNGTSADGVGETAVRNQLAIVEGGQYGVELLLGVLPARGIPVLHLLVLVVLKCGKPARHGTVQPQYTVGASQFARSDSFSRCALYQAHGCTPKRSGGCPQNDTKNPCLDW